MARKKYQEEPDNHERWLVSYADFITLLFAFFVVMYAISSLNDGKYRVLSNSLNGAFGTALSDGGTVLAMREAQPNILPALANARRKKAESMQKEREKMKNVARDILTVLEPLVREGVVRVTQTSRGVMIEINASVLFAPGEAKLNPKSLQVLNVVSNVLKNDNHEIQVEGFTDNVPIKNSSFPSNWELSAVRASTVARLFIANGVAELRLTAVGQGPKSPVDSNETVEGRARNRRVAVTIMSVMPENAVEVPVSTN
ncbi:MAG: flagellar motor protein MotD [Undibacterium sp.]|nr:flagellar motor protein MotD [Undibacterium sp.]